MSKTVSARITKETHDKLTETCNKVGCTVNDYLNGAIDLALTGSTQQDLGDGMDGLDEDPVKPLKILHVPKSQENMPENKDIPKAKVIKVSYDDGKTWINLH